MLSGRSVTGILHFVNKCPIDWYSKKQGTVETATFGSEANAARTATEQIIDLRGTLRYMGVPLRESSYMFGDNKTVVDSGSLPHVKLHKRHTMLSYHRVREAIASGMVKFFHIPGEINPADILSKHWGHQQIWKQLQPLLFWKGDTRKWGLDVLKSAWYPNWLLVNLKPKFLKLNTRMNGFFSSQMCILMEDGLLPKSLSLLLSSTTLSEIGKRGSSVT